MNDNFKYNKLYSNEVGDVEYVNENETFDLPIYIASNNPSGALKVLAKHGYDKPQNYDDLIAALTFGMQNESFVIDLMKQHPDFPVIKEIVVKEWRRNKPQQPLNPPFINFTNSTQPTTTQQTANSQTTSSGIDFSRIEEIRNQMNWDNRVFRIFVYVIGGLIVWKILQNISFKTN